MGFGESVSTCASKYATFSGRAPRSEYWFFTLFSILILMGAVIVDAALFEAPVLYAICGLALILPSLSVAVRRLHDTNRSGWWYLIGLVPLVGGIVLLIFFCTEGMRGSNDFGEAESSGAIA